MANGYEETEEAATDTAISEVERVKYDAEMRLRVPKELKSRCETVAAEAKYTLNDWHMNLLRTAVGMPSGLS